MQKQVRVNVLRMPDGIRPESVRKAAEAVQAFAKHLRKLGSVDKAVAQTAADVFGARAEPGKPKKTDEDKK